MRRFTLLVGAVLLAATAAWAQNDVAWRSFFGSTVTDSLSPGGCLRVVLTSSNTTAEEANFVFVGGQRVTFQFEPDRLGSGSTGDVDLFSCTHTDGDGDGVLDLDACEELNLRDTDADGIPDSNRFDGDSVGQRGTLDPISVAGYFYASLGSAAPGAGEEFEVVVCSVP